MRLGDPACGFAVFPRVAKHHEAHIRDQTNKKTNQPTNKPTNQPTNQPTNTTTTNNNSNKNKNKNKKKKKKKNNNNNNTKTITPYMALDSSRLKNILHSPCSCSRLVKIQSPRRAMPKEVKVEEPPPRTTVLVCNKAAV